MDKSRGDFIRTGMGGVDVSGDSAHALLPPDQGQKRPGLSLTETTPGQESGSVASHLLHPRRVRIPEIDDDEPSLIPSW
jgi:hypothetical protein